MSEQQSLLFFYACSLSVKKSLAVPGEGEHVWMYKLKSQKSKMEREISTRQESYGKFFFRSVLFFVRCLAFNPQAKGISIPPACVLDKCFQDLKANTRYLTAQHAESLNHFSSMKRHATSRKINVKIERA